METHAKVRHLATDILDTPDDTWRYEVIEGDLFMTAAPIPAHQRATQRLSSQLDVFTVARDLGVVFSAPIAVLLDGHTGVEPDIVYLRRERLGLIGKLGIEGTPDLIVEVLSPSTRARDRGLKFRAYARAGVPHYWLVDVDRRVLEAYQLEAGVYVLTGTYSSTASFEPELFPGLSIPVASLWL